MVDFLWDRPAGPARASFLFAHGAGAPMDATFMTRMAGLLALEGLSVVRFEFGYMANRRVTGKKRPAPKAETMIPDYHAAIDQLLGETDGPVLIGGKSMGGRIAAMASADALDARVKGLVCLGFPFHPPGQPEKLRRAPLEQSRLPRLVVQGDRDEFGNRELIEGLGLDPAIGFAFIPDGSHDFGPRGGTGTTLKANCQLAATAISGFVTSLIV